MNTSCIVLAGGKGSRLGKDKVLETIGSKYLLEQVISSVNPLGKEIILVRARGQNIPQSISHPKLRIVTDITPDKGPLGGIYTGLALSGSLYNLVIAGDMPFLNRKLLRYLLQAAVGFDLAVPRLGEKLEPLHAVYARDCLPTIAGMIERDNLSVNKLVGSVRTRYVEADEIGRFDPAHLSFFNINTSHDLERARELAGRDGRD